MPTKYNIDIDSYIGYPISKGYVRGKLQGLKGQPVAVRINSYGGDVQTALDIRQQFIDHGQVTAYIFGMTASAATILATGAEKIVMSRYALMLVHPCSQWVDTWGQLNADELSAEIERLKGTAADMKNIDHVIAAIYAARSGKSEKQMADTMQAARWLNADECLELGLVDELLEPEEEESSATATLTATEREHFSACGLPLPEVTTAAPTESAEGLVKRLLNLFKNKSAEPDVPEAEAPEAEAQTSEPAEATEVPEATENEQNEIAMKKENNTPEQQTEVLKAKRLLAAAGLDELTAADNGYTLSAAAIAAIEDRLEKLESENEELRSADGAETADVQPEANPADELPGTACAQFFAKFKHLI